MKFQGIPEPYQRTVNKEDPDALLEKLSKLMIPKKSETEGNKLEESKQSQDRSALKTPKRSQKRSTSSERQLDNISSSKPPLGDSTKRSNISKKSSGTKSIKYNKAEDDTEYMDMSIYDDKNYKERQDDFIKERIQSQNKPKPQTAVKKEEDAMTEPKTTLPAISRGNNNSKIKRPKYNLAKEGAIKDRKDNKSEISEKHSHEHEEDVKHDDRNPMLQSIIKYNESQGMYIIKVICDYIGIAVGDEDKKPDKIKKDFYPSTVNDNVSGKFHHFTSQL